MSVEAGGGSIPREADREAGSADTRGFTRGGRYLVAGSIAAVIATAAVGLYVAVVRVLAAGEADFQRQQLLLARLVAERVGDVVDRAWAVAETLEPDRVPAGDDGTTRAWLAVIRARHRLPGWVDVRVDDPARGPAQSDERRGAVGVVRCASCEGPDIKLFLRGPPDAAGRQIEVALPLAALSDDLFARVRSGEQGYAWMIDGERRVVGNVGREQIGTRPFGRDIAPELDAMLAAMVRGEAGTGVYAWAGDRRLAAYAPVPVRQLGFSVGISADASEVTRRLGDAVRAQLATGVAFLVAVGAVAALLWRERRRRWMAERALLEERLALERMLVDSERLAMLGTLTACVAHEIRNPVGVIEGGLSVVEWAEQDRDVVAGMRDASTRLVQIARDLTDFARPTAGSERRCDASDAARSALRIAAPRHRRGPRVEDRVPALPAVAIDGGHLVQVVLNLVMNAIDSAGPQGHVVVRGDVEPDRVVLRVEDDGPGIAPGIRSSLFAPFATTKERGKGTGLGLFICRSLLEAGGGSIMVDPQHRPGAAFEVRLPRAT